jgi:uncharacterized membrane protein YdbT with pleckstrin-like domain
MSRPEQPTETTLWEGRPSQWTNFPWFLACLLMLPIPFAIYHYLRVQATRWRLTNHRLRLSTGILNKHLDDLELYRIKDITLSQPLIQRLVGLGSINLVTSDASTPLLTLAAIPDSLAVMDQIRHEVDRVRRERGVRELDLHDGDVLTGG